MRQADILDGRNLTGSSHVKRVFDGGHTLLPSSYFSRVRACSVSALRSYSLAHWDRCTPFVGSIDPIPLRSCSALLRFHRDPFSIPSKLTTPPRMCKPRDSPRELGRIMQREEEDDRAIVVSTAMESSPSRLSLSSSSTGDVNSPRNSVAAVAAPAAAVDHQQQQQQHRKLICATLLVHKRKKSVLYAEAGKDFVDTLMGFLTLPMSSALKLLRDSGSLPQGGISSVYSSTLELDDSLLYSDKEQILDPKPALRASDLFPGGSSSSSSNGISSACDQLMKQKIYFKCSNHGCLRFVIDLPGQICPVCKFAMSHKLELIVPGNTYPPPSPHRSSGFGKQQQRSGFVRKNRNFIITDSLEILPLSTITSVMLLAKLNLESLQDLESVQVNIGTTEILQLLKASLSSQTALNDVFKGRIISAASQQPQH